MGEGCFVVWGVLLCFVVGCCGSVLWLGFVVGFVVGFFVGMGWPSDSSRPAGGMILVEFFVGEFHGWILWWARGYDAFVVGLAEWLE